MNLLKTITLLAVLLTASAQLSAQNKMTQKGIGEEIHQDARIAGACDDLQDAEKMQECSNKAIYKALISNLNYPAEARENSIQGTVLLNFAIEKDGRISDPYVKNDIGGGCGNACIEALLSMNVKFIPAKNKNGEAIISTMEVPVKFSFN